MADAHSSLEVDHTQSGLQVDYSQACGRKILVDSDVAHFNTYKIFNPDVTTLGTQIALEETKVQPFVQQRTYKLSRRIFWAIVIAAIVIITATVVGVGVRLSIPKSKPEQVQSTAPGTTVSIASSATTSAAMSIVTILTTTPSNSAPTTSQPTKAPSFESTLRTSSNISANTKVIPSSASATTILPPPGQTATLISDCPSSNNTLFTLDISSFKISFRKMCGVALINSQGTANSVSQAAASLDDCISMCASYNALNRAEFAAGSASICNAVCWRNANAPPGEVYGWCFGYTTTNSSNALAYIDSPPCDAAAWIDQRFK